MKSKLFYFCLLFIGCSAFAQTTVYFKYDEAGNQRYRGDDVTAQTMQSQSLRQAATSEPTDEEKFWSMIQVYPVPVKDELTIGWSDEADEMIDHVTLYQHNTVANVFTKKNLPNLNRKVQVNMNGMYMGVYILSFQLKDGRKMSRNIIKL
ncbi:T9SS type A sorting domain-containing protein [Chryseobacterium taklimakanense]|uniref:Secretion system C-terminal sorting domain-containing protein n=1 Tax=Chryseobacterium taklimakanense TaxID=536441 RepID=A0A3G8WY02_9FLAO|nr:T9SS type A sorting domain-containing protein [Chryseobacterium taklimakanense]AZI20646.1 hypothetical protein EIH08_07910 [Chryseobacterium taklimakanense]